MTQTLPAGAKSTNCIFILDTKLSYLTQGYTNFWCIFGRYGRDLKTEYILTAVFHLYPQKLYSVCLTDVSKKTLNVQSVEGFSSYHNFAYETSGVRVWKSYEIGPGKLILFDGVF